jgi:hypothetical protein
MTRQSLCAIALLASAMLAVPVLAEPSGGAPIEAVVGACEKMDAAKASSCVMSVGKDGLDGCTSKGCFFCPADGSRKCYSASRNGRNNDFTIGRTRLRAAATPR